MIIDGKTGPWEIVIGLEVHAQVISKAKLFSGASTEFGAEPNAQVSFVDAGFPGRRAARVEITLRDGRRFTHLQPNRKGDPEEPLEDHELEGKLLELAGPVIGEPAARALFEQIWGLEGRPHTLLAPCSMD